MIDRMAKAAQNKTIAMLRMRIKLFIALPFLESELKHDLEKPNDCFY